MTSLAHPKVLHQYLNLLDKRPNRFLSQNFLIDSNIVTNFVQRAHLSEQDTVLEIGPGPGAFTQEIVKSGAQIILIERDATFVKGLQEQYKNEERVRIIHGDFLTCNLDEILPAEKKVKVLSNLPFKLTSPILSKLFPLTSQIESCLFIMQKEVGDRILANPKTKLFSSLSIFTRFFTDPSLCFHISANCFYPKPRVNCSALLFRIHPPLLKKYDHFFDLMRTCFNQRRKMLSSTLPFPLLHTQHILKSLSLSEKSRPEDLDILNWIQLFEALHLSSS